MQHELFEKDFQSKTNNLVISRSVKKVLTKNQQAFNKLTLRIEKLHKDIENKELQFDLAIKIYGNEIHPTVSRLAGCRRQLVTILWDVYQSKKLSKTDQQYLKKILFEHVEELCAHTDGGADEALKEMFKLLQGESFESSQQRERELLKKDIEAAVDELDLDIDLEDLDMNNIVELAKKIAEVEQKMAEKQEIEQHQFGQFKRKRKKTAKQVENERIQKSVDEMKQKNISTIYKQLAKLFHPDLEYDEDRKAEKEVLMKELTSAYEAKNLHTLLMLELKWIHKENDHLESLDEEKLTIYLQILKEQAMDLEREINGMFQQPRYSVLVQTFGMSVQRMPIQTVNQHLLEIRQIESSFKKDLEDFQSPNALKHIKMMINEWKAIQRQNERDEAEFMRMMF